MSRHEGVSCDSCLRNNFKGRRYKCLVCFDYDLCENCFESGAASARHVSSHAMQCMLPRAEYELYYAGESASLSTDTPLALTCPYCGRMGLTEAALYEHACCEHSDLAVEVVCPVCASQPGGEPNNLVLDFVAHIQREHRASAATAAAGGGGGDEGHHVGGGHHGVPLPSHSSGLQIQQNAAQQQNGTSVQHDLRQQPRRMPSRGAPAGGGSGGGLGSRTSRRHPQMAFAAMPLSPRDSAMESITELLSQLSGTRRAVSAAAAAQSAHSAVPSAQQTIQQLQMQLERQHSALTRQQLSDKLPRRTGTLLDVGGAGASGLLPPHQAGTLTSGQQDGAQQGSLANAPGHSQYLLARYLNDGVVGSGGRTANAIPAAPALTASVVDSSAPPLSGRAGPDRAQFVENLLLNSLLPNSALWKLHCATTTKSSSHRKSLSSFNFGDASGGSSSNCNTSNNNNSNGRSKYSQSRSETSEKLTQTTQDNSQKQRQQEQVEAVAEQANTTDDSSIADDEEEWGDLAVVDASAAVWDNRHAAAASGSSAGSFSAGGPSANSGDAAGDASEGNDGETGGGGGGTVSRVTPSNQQNDGSNPPANGCSRR